MNCKAKGWRSENKARRILDSMGYGLVVRSGASLGLFDLVALGVDRDNVLLIQVKSNRNPSPIVSCMAFASCNCFLI